MASYQAHLEKIVAEKYPDVSPAQREELGRRIYKAVAEFRDAQEKHIAERREQRTPQHQPAPAIVQQRSQGQGVSIGH